MVAADRGIVSRAGLVVENVKLGKEDSVEAFEGLADAERVGPSCVAGQGR